MLVVGRLSLSLSLAFVGCCCSLLLFVVVVGSRFGGVDVGGGENCAGVAVCMYVCMYVCLFVCVCLRVFV